MHKLSWPWAFSTSIALLTPVLGVAYEEIPSNLTQNISKSIRMVCVSHNWIDITTNSRILPSLNNQTLTQVQHMSIWHVICAFNHEKSILCIQACKRVEKNTQVVHKTKGACIKCLSLNLQCLQPWSIWMTDVSCKTMKHTYVYRM